MNMLFPHMAMRGKRKPSIEIYHDYQFPPQDILGVLIPLFGQFYTYNNLIEMIQKADHIFCAYDKKTGQCIGCALITIAETQDGLYLQLFGVRQTSQGRGVGTHLLKRIIRWAYQSGYWFISLHAAVNN